MSIRISSLSYFSKWYYPNRITNRIHIGMLVNIFILPSHLRDTVHRILD